jgi:hypothetical protein
VEAFPVQINGQELICVRDPEALAEQPIYLNQVLMFLVSRMDGRHGLRDIQADFFQAAGEILPMDTLEHFVTQLDEQHYLIGPSFRNFYSSLVESFQNEPSRPARHEGTAYEEKPEALASQLQSYASHPDGPENDSTGAVSAPLRGLIAPHIDFQRGGQPMPMHTGLWRCIRMPTPTSFLEPAMRPCRSAIQFQKRIMKLPLGQFVPIGISSAVFQSGWMMNTRMIFHIARSIR